MLLNNRIIWSDNGTLKDISVQMNNFHSGAQVLPIIAAEDAIYIGSDMPFNHRYIQVSVANTSSCAISVSLWDGNAFVPAVDVIDQTSVGGKTLAQSGILSWVPDRNQVWDSEDTSEDIAELASLKIYKMFWAKLTFSADLLIGTTLSYIGHKFATDEDLGAHYPELILSATMVQFASGKTNWNEQHIAAAEIIIRDLRRKNIVWSRNQILDWEQFRDAESHKIAEIVFNAFGDAYKDNRAQAQDYYKKAFEMQVFNVDRDMDARLDPSEKQIFAGIFRR